MDVKNGIGLLIALFITLLLGSVFVSTITDNVFERTEIYSTKNESFTGSNITATQLVNADIIQGTLRVYNTTTLISLGNFSIDYTKGTLILVGPTNYTLTGALYNATYNYYPPDYVKDNSSRVILGLLGLLFAIGLMFGAYSLLAPKFKNFG